MFSAVVIPIGAFHFIFRAGHMRRYPLLFRPSTWRNFLIRIQIPELLQWGQLLRAVSLILFIFRHFNRRRSISTENGLSFFMRTHHCIFANHFGENYTNYVIVGWCATVSTNVSIEFTVYKCSSSLYFLY